MKQITTLCAGVFFSFVLIAQQTTSVTAGIGCGDISIGMTEIQVKAILGDSMEEKTFKEEMTECFCFQMSLTTVMSLKTPRLTLK